MRVLLWLGARRISDEIHSPPASQVSGTKLTLCHASCFLQRHVGEMPIANIGVCPNVMKLFLSLLNQIFSNIHGWLVSEYR